MHGQVASMTADYGQISQKRNISTSEMKRFSHFCSMWPWTSTFRSQERSQVILVQHYVYNKFYTKSDRRCATLNEAHREGHIIIYILFASWVAQVTRSQAVARIADRTASRRLWLERQFSLTGDLTQFRSRLFGGPLDIMRINLIIYSILNCLNWRTFIHPVPKTNATASIYSSTHSAGLCTMRAMRPHRAVKFRGPPFLRKVDSAEFTALSCN